MPVLTKKAKQNIQKYRKQHVKKHGKTDILGTVKRIGSDIAGSVGDMAQIALMTKGGMPSSSLVKKGLKAIQPFTSERIGKKVGASESLSAHVASAIIPMPTKAAKLSALLIGGLKKVSKKPAIGTGSDLTKSLQEAAKTRKNALKRTAGIPASYKKDIESRTTKEAKSDIGGWGDDMRVRYSKKSPHYGNRALTKSELMHYSYGRDIEHAELVKGIKAGTMEAPKIPLVETVGGGVKPQTLTYSQKKHIGQLQNLEGGFSNKPFSEGWMLKPWKGLAPAKSGKVQEETSGAITGKGRSEYREYRKVEGRDPAKWMDTKTGEKQYGYGSPHGKTPPSKFAKSPPIEKTETISKDPIKSKKTKYDLMSHKEKVQAHKLFQQDLKNDGTKFSTSHIVDVADKIQSGSMSGLGKLLKIKPSKYTEKKKVVGIGMHWPKKPGKKK